MDRVDGGEQLIATRPVARQALANQRVAFSGQCPIPASAVLFAERDQLSVAHPRLTPGLGEHHQCEQPGHLRLIGEQHGRSAGLLALQGLQRLDLLLADEPETGAGLGHHRRERG